MPPPSMQFTRKENLCTLRTMLHDKKNYGAHNSAHVQGLIYEISSVHYCSHGTLTMQSKSSGLLWTYWFEIYICIIDSCYGKYT